MKRFTNQSNGSHVDRMNYGGAIIRRFALFPLMLLMLLLLPAGMVAQKAASSSKYIATYESDTETLTFKKNVGETLPENSAWVEDKQTVATINNNIGNGTIVHIVFDKSFRTYTPTSLNRFFYNLTKLKTITGLEYLNTENVTDMGYMFYGCSALTSLDVTHFNTAKVTNMSYMFSSCVALTSLDVTKFNTANVTDMSGMFSGCKTLTSLDVSKFNTVNVTNMSYMFSMCKLTSLDVSKFNTVNVTNMNYMFVRCSRLTSLDVTNFNTEKVTNMRGMFFGCVALTSLDVTKFNTEKVTIMGGMFSGCKTLTSLDVTKFNTEKVTIMGGMFSGCQALTTIYASDKFVTGQVTDGSNMFSNCTNLKGFIDCKNNSDKTDHTYANYKTGYFTKLVGKNGDEKIGATGETLATDNLVLDDDKDFVAYEPFAAKAASYNRTMNAGTTWATLCLPFEVSLANQNFRAFKLLSADEGTETVELEEIEGSIAAGTPVIIKMKDGATKLNFTVANKEIAKDVQTAETANGNYQLQGLYTQKEFSKDADNNCYIVKGSKLMNPAKLLDKTTTESVGSKPFRAYMVDNSSAPAAGARMFSISVGGSTTAIEQLETTADSKAEYYDLQGRRLQNLQKGVNIVKRGGKTMKFIIK
ncbi:BspA family leucine-rich repeat surface protein [Segatella copri]|uniref:BspA family leucine-rich repeat surface protein n=1 Tax=Segatella copri TaxID=165179 RepID=UPI001932D954|nr:BspA family leucine-rich repeat surface protein [Segatella copri]MBM0130686.1 BspA family leucine-rich repeat surface protein [Segatella copri]